MSGRGDAQRRDGTAADVTAERRTYTYYPPAYACERGVTLTLVGCGGTGSNLADPLAGLLMDLAECRRGGVALPATAPGRYPLRLRLVDPDRVEVKNIGRSNFGRGDVGRNKATALAERYRDAFGVVAEVYPMAFRAEEMFRDTTEGFHILVGCVDNTAARRELHRALDLHASTVVLLDTGNDHDGGQVLLGSRSQERGLAGAFDPLVGACTQLPAPGWVFPTLLTYEDVPARPPLLPAGTGGGVAGGTGPGGQQALPPRDCATRVLAREQSFTINRLMADAAFDMLYDLLLGQLRHFATYLSRDGGTLVRPVSLSPHNVASAVRSTPAALSLVRGRRRAR